MSRAWQYPVYVLPHGPGYLSIVDRRDRHQPTHLLVVHGELSAATALMARFGILGTPRPLHNDREFRWLLQSLQAPITHVAFDPTPTDEQVNARVTLTVAALLDEQLKPDKSPWNYPVYAITQDSGFASIQGRASDGRSLMAVGIFSSRDRADAYLEDSRETGRLCTLANVQEAKNFFESLGPEVHAVALDPKVEGDRRTARHCFALQTLLSKYLVLEP